MNPPRPRCETPAITEIESLISADQRRTCSVEKHLHFIRSISTDSRGVDAIDRMLDEEIEVDPYVSGTNNRRSDRELNRMLNLIDNLPISTNGTDGHA